MLVRRCCIIHQNRDKFLQRGIVPTLEDIKNRVDLGGEKSNELKKSLPLVLFYKDKKTTCGKIPRVLSVTKMYSGRKKK